MSTSKAMLQAKRNRELRRRRVVAALLGCGLVVGGTGAFTAIVWPGYAIARGTAAESSIETIPRQHLRFQPLVREGEQSALESSLPDVVEGWVQTGVSAHRDWQGDGALEAWSVLYLDAAPLLANTTGVPQAPAQMGGTFGKANSFGAGTASADSYSSDLREAAHGSGVTVTIGQWRTWKGANEFLTSSTESIANPILKGDVFRGEEKMGRYVLAAASGNSFGSLPADILESDAPGVMWWRNGTVVVRISGPIRLLSSFYSAYPL